MESKWKPVTKLPFCYSRGIHLHHLPGATIWDSAFRWTWGAGFLLYMYRIMGWEVFVTNNEYLFQLPPKLRLPWVCFTWGRGMDCMIRSINFLKDKSTLKIQKSIARNKNCEWRIPECFLCHPSLWRKNLWTSIHTLRGNCHLNVCVDTTTVVQNQWHLNHCHFLFYNLNRCLLDW